MFYIAVKYSNLREELVRCIFLYAANLFISQIDLLISFFLSLIIDIYLNV